MEYETTSYASHVYICTIIQTTRLSCCIVIRATRLPCIRICCQALHVGMNSIARCLIHIAQQQWGASAPASCCAQHRIIHVSANPNVNNMSPQTSKRRVVTMGHGVVQSVGGGRYAVCLVLVCHTLRIKNRALCFPRAAPPDAERVPRHARVPLVQVNYRPAPQQRGDTRVAYLISPGPLHASHCM